MKKKTKGIIALSSAVVVLGAVVTVLLVTSPEEESEEDLYANTSDSSAKTTKLLYDKDPNKITTLTVTNENGGYTVEKYADDFWTIPDISGFPLDYDTVNSSVDAIATVTAQTVIEGKDDLEAYGLDNPAVTVSAKSDDNSFEKTMYIGSVTPKGDCYYVKFEGESDIYTIKTSDISIFENKEYDFINHVIYDDVTDDDTEDDYDPKKINSMTIKRADLPYDIEVIYDVRKDSDETLTGNSSSHVMVSPVSLDLSPDKSDTTLNMIFGLTATDVAAVDPDENTLEEYGLKSPACTVIYDINASAATLYIGNKTSDGYYYVMRDGLDVVYTLPAESVPWITTEPLDLTMTMITSTYIYTIDTIDIEHDGTTEHFELSGSADTDDFAVKWNDEDFEDTESFKTFYQYILRAPAEELYLEENTEDPTLTVTITSETGTDKLEFIPSDNRMTIIRRNGQTSFKCRTAYVDRFLENIEKLRNGEEIVSSW